MDGPIKVLVIEDSATDRRFALRILEAIGCTVKLAENGQLGMDLATTEQFDVILMDCSLPDFSGYDCTTHIRSLPGYGAGETAIIAFTANATMEDINRCKAVGMDSVLLKPVTAAALEDMVRHWVSVTRR